MSTWFKENKSSVVTAGIGLLLVAGIVGAGISKQFEAEGLLTKIRDAESNIQQLARDKMPPNEQILKTTTEEVKTYTESIAAVAEEYAPYHEKCVLENMSGTDFQNELRKASDTWKKICAEKGIAVAPEAQNMGFDKYVASSPSSEAAPTLNFERQGINFFLSKLAECGATKMIRVYRTQLPIELSPEELAKQQGGKAPAPRGGCAAQSSGKAIWQAMPFEVAFTGDRQTVSTFLNEILSNDQYLFTVSALRVRNEMKVTPNFEKTKRATSAAAQKPASTGGGIVLSGGDASATVQQPTSTAEEKPEAEEIPEAKEILRQVLGTEKVEVYFAANLIYFPSEQATTTEENK